MTAYETYPHLPLPTKPRWQPLRAGLVNLFYYDYEEFWFQDGHLLLRGNNGTGKSKVLALTLPFLLDGQTTPARIEPDGDPGKRMEWNLLLGGRYSERLGYTWLEFGRLSESGQVETVTLGCGLKAVQGRGSPRSWFFKTDLRIGQDLWLIDHEFTLGRERLIEALGSRGNVFDTAARYRRAVDDKLFRLGEERYNALVNLLIQLRQPQLSKRPNEQALSAALTEALPPLDQAVLSDVAEAFRSLDTEREELDGLEEARQAVDQFRGHYRHYAQIAARRRAREVRQAQGRFDKVSGELNETRTALEDSQQRQQQAEADIDTLAGRLTEARTSERTLRDSPEMRDANALRQAERTAEEKADLAREAHQRRQEAEQDLARRRERLREREVAVARSLEAVNSAITEAEDHARSAWIDPQHQAILAPLHLPDGEPEASAGQLTALIKTAESQGHDLMTRRRRAVQHLKDLNHEVEQAQYRLTEVRGQLQTELDQAERLEEDRLQAEQTVQTAGQALVEAFDRFARNTRELRILEPEAMAGELAGWVTSLVGENPATTAFNAAYRGAADQLAGLRARELGERQAVQAHHDQLAEERMRLEAGEHARPPIPYTRDEAARLDRPGAPLWQLVDFRDDIADHARAGLEAALEAAGLLDAWVMPDGALLAADTGDVVLTPDTPVDDNLNQLLIPAVDREDPRAASVTDTVLEEILSCIGCGESGPVWVSGEGRWRLGPAHGAWQKETARYIGRGAREAARRRRIEELNSLLAQAHQELNRIEDRLQALAERQQVLEREWQAIPADAGLRDAHGRVSYLLEQRRLAQTRIDRAEAQVARARETAEHRTQQRDQAGSDLHLPTAPNALEAVTEAVSNYRVTMSAFWPRLRHHWDNHTALRQAGSENQEAEWRLQQSAEQAAEKTQTAQQAAAHRDTLRASVGASVAELEQRLAEIERLIRELDVEEKRVQKSLIEWVSQTGRLSARGQDLEAQLERERGDRQLSVRAWQDFASTGLLTAAVPAIALPDRTGEWPVNAAVQLARQVEQELQQVDDGDSAWNRHQRGLFEHLTALQGALSRHGHEAGAEQTDSGLIVRVVFQSRQCSPDELAERLQAEVRERQALLNARERELLENHLISEVASYLQTMISAAEWQVQRMNEELEQRPTSTGMKLRFVWRPLEDGQDGAPVGLMEARRRLLRQISAAWSAEDREAIGRFLQQQIETVRSASEGGTLLEHLEKALDYRRWHRFRVERWQDGQWRPATGPASGGERVLAVTIPLFAAASSHYGSAGQHAPRLVLLDEAFAGVDDDSRAKCMGLLAQFDLDFVMTSEREWGCYADLPGLAIAQLARREGIDAVFVTRWTWNGLQRERMRAELPPMEAPAEPPEEVLSEIDTDSNAGGALF